MRTWTTAELEAAMTLERRRLRRLEANIRSLSAASTWRSRHKTCESYLGHPRMPSSSPNRSKSRRDVSCGDVVDSRHASPCSAERKSRETISQHRKRWLAFRNADVINRLTLESSSSSKTIAKRRERGRTLKETDSEGKTCHDSTGEGNVKATAKEHRPKEQSSAVDRHKRTQTHTPTVRRPKKPSLDVRTDRLRPEVDCQKPSLDVRTDRLRPEVDGQKPPLDAVRTDRLRPEVDGQKPPLDAVRTDRLRPEVDGQKPPLDAVRTDRLRPEVDGQKPPLDAVRTDRLRPEVDGQKPPLDAVRTDRLRPEVGGQKPPLDAVRTDRLRPEVDGQKPPLDPVRTGTLRPEVDGLDKRLRQERVHAQTNNTTPQADVVTGGSDVSEIRRPREGAHVTELKQTVTVIAHRSVRLA